MENKRSLTGISLFEYERRIIIQESERRGLYNLSATVRQIIREWDNMRQERELAREEDPYHRNLGNN